MICIYRKEIYRRCTEISYPTILYPHHTNLRHTEQIIFLTYPPCSSKNSFNHPSHSNLFCAETLQLAGKLELATRSASVHIWMGWKPPKTNMLPIFRCYIVAWTRYVRVRVQVPWTKEQGSGFIPILYQQYLLKSNVNLELQPQGSWGGLSLNQTILDTLEVSMVKTPGKRMQLIWRQKNWGNKHLWTPKKKAIPKGNSSSNHAFSGASCWFQGRVMGWRSYDISCSLVKDGIKSSQNLGLFAAHIMLSSPHSGLRTGFGDHVLNPLIQLFFGPKKEVAPVDAQNAAAFLLGWRKHKKKNMYMEQLITHTYVLLRLGDFSW